MRFISFESRSVRWGAVVSGIALLSAACDTNKVLDVYDGAVATPGSLTTEASIPAFYFGALGDFTAAWDGNGLTDAFVPTSGLLADEFRSSDTFTTRNDADRRTQAAPANGNLADNSYVALQRTRRSTEVGAAFITGFKTAADPRVSELKALAGYTYVAFGEAFCGNVPVPPTARAEEILPAAGIGTIALFDTSIVRFNAAIADVGATPTGAALTARNLASVGLGRALLNEGKYSEASAAVATVPTSFVYKLFYSSNTGREQNSLWNLNGSNNRYTMSDLEGTNGLNYRSANDPRIPWRRLALGFDQTTIVYQQLLQPSADADVPLADGVEARLIQAEALLNAGNPTWLDTLNSLRANVGALEAGRYSDFALVSATDSVTNSTLPPLVDPGTPAARVDLVFRERAFWLYATGHRLSDMRRLIRNYSRSAATVYPVGTSPKNGAFGNDVNLAIAFGERNNTAYVPSACITTAP